MVFEDITNTTSAEGHPALWRPEDPCKASAIPVPQKTKRALLREPAIARSPEITKASSTIANKPITCGNGTSSSSEASEPKTPHGRMLRTTSAPPRRVLLKSCETMTPKTSRGVHTPRNKVELQTRHAPKTVAYASGYENSSHSAHTFKTSEELSMSARNRFRMQTHQTSATRATQGMFAEAMLSPELGNGPKCENMDDDKDTWAVALWDQRQRRQVLRNNMAEAKRNISALHARKTEAEKCVTANSCKLTDLLTCNDRKMSAMHEQTAKLLNEFDLLEADIIPEEKKSKIMMSGVHAKECELSRYKQQLLALQDAKLENMVETEAKIALGENLVRAATLEEVALKMRDELMTENVMFARRIHNEYLRLKGNIRVFCRLRPMFPNEGHEIIKFETHDNSQLTVHSKLQKNATGLGEHSNAWRFSFDHVFEPDATQAAVFEEIALLVQSVLDGYRVAIFAYGQTGSGKTYTMEGPHLELYEANTAGVIPRTVDLIFTEVHEMRQKGWAFEVHVTLLEVYNEAVYDILASHRGRNAPHKAATATAVGQHEAGVTELFTAELVEDAAAVHALLRRAARERHVASTLCNDRSSRSHAIVQLSLTGRNQSTDCSSEVRGLLSFVDLAGSERVDKSGVTGERLRESQHINRSLSALGDVIEALTRRGQSSNAYHVPYRNSRLTMLLKDSLNGDSKALMFVNVSPCMQHFPETLSSLRFASKVHSCNIGVSKRHIADLGSGNITKHDPSTKQEHSLDTT